MSAHDAPTAAAAPLPAPKDPHLRRVANAIRALAMDSVEQAKSGHPGTPMGMADVATVLFSQFLKFDASDPDWPDRDRFVLSAGHASILLYSLLHLTGYADMTLDELKRFRQLGSKTAGHPERGLASGIEVTTGPLGQGITNSVGLALAERLLAAEFGEDLVNHRTYAICGDGCLMEGISHEALSLAGHLKLSKLIVLWDNNSVTIDGPTSLAVNDDQVARFAAHGWATDQVDGHDTDAVTAAIKKAQGNDRPTMIACKTIIGFGAPTKAGTAAVHGSPLGAEELKGAKERLGWEYPAFVIPDDVRAWWRGVGERGGAVRRDWEGRLRQAEVGKREDFQRRFRNELPAAVTDALAKARDEFRAKNAKIATRVASGEVLNALVPALPELVGGSADLTPSNNTKAKGQAEVQPPTYAGRYIHYGVREKGMSAAMNGIVAHGGLIPYGGSFLQFTDYARGAIRLSALSHLGVIYVMTHDSIGLGEDGPTHQPVEHLASLRAIPNLLLFRPADPIETAECWRLALDNRRTPSVLALTRQGLPLLRTAPDHGENKSAKGAYVLIEPSGTRHVTLLATGSEVSIAVEAQKQLATSGIRAAVVSMPCWELFERQDEAYHNAVLGSAPRVGVEAGVRMGWNRWLGRNAHFVGMTGFGASAPAEALFPHFHITAERVAEMARTLVSSHAGASRDPTPGRD
jgi:transketolase